ncbi:MAG TPA: hemolysin III family protein [Nocardioidaceae bacterium]|nr:hemolysin III family protein [Nocardioidaceae bacterium]
MSATSSSSARDHGVSVGEVTERLTEHTREILHEVKPRLRGWLHAAIAPVTLVAGVVLVLQAPSPSVRLGVGVFVASAVVLFGVSALYHRRTWSPRVTDRLRRLDHANIFVHIAGTYTAFSMLMLEPPRATTLLIIVWIATAFGVAFRVWWIDAPRWLHTPAYVLVGSVAVFFAADFAHHAGRPSLTLMLAGGVLYLVGALVYGVQRPNPLPRWFGFHEVFHAFTVLAFATHYAGVSLGTQNLV